MLFGGLAQNQVFFRSLFSPCGDAIVSSSETADTRGITNLTKTCWGFCFK
jgi:hypothetical protein